jgi:ankyrin repeat protein
MNDILEAVISKDTALLSQMLEAGYAVNIQDEDGRTPLIQAVIDHNVEMVKLL